MSGIFDTHAHYMSEAFDADRDAVLQQQWNNGVVAVIEQSTCPQDVALVLQLAQKYPRVYAAVGIHPQLAAGVTEQQLQQVYDQCHSPKVVAVGEIGLDYYYEDACPRGKQKEVFAAQLEWANALRLPVSVHDREAHADVMDMLNKYRPRGVIHCFSGSVEMMRQAVEMGLYIGLGGVVTFRNAKKAVEVAAQVPLDRLLIETDAPYMSPEPMRGKRCESRLLCHVAEKVADVRGITVEQLLKQTQQNACELFGISPETL